jgi:hypothetical protein
MISVEKQSAACWKWPILLPSILEVPAGRFHLILFYILLSATLQRTVTWTNCCKPGFVSHEYKCKYQLQFSYNFLSCPFMSVAFTNVLFSNICKQFHLSKGLTKTSFQVLIMYRYVANRAIGFMHIFIERLSLMRTFLQQILWVRNS